MKSVGGMSLDSAEQLVQRDPEMLRGDVVQRDVERAFRRAVVSERAVERLAGAPERCSRRVDAAELDIDAVKRVEQEREDGGDGRGRLAVVGVGEAFAEPGVARQRRRTSG